MSSMNDKESAVARKLPPSEPSQVVIGWLQQWRGFTTSLQGDGDYCKSASFFRTLTPPAQPLPAQSSTYIFRKEKEWVKICRTLQCSLFALNQ